MPLTKSVEKRLRQSQRKRTANRYVRTSVRTQEKKIKTASNFEEASEHLKKYTSLIDKAVKKKIGKSATASRKKSRLTKFVNSMKK